MHRLVSLIVGIIGIALAGSAGAANIDWSKLDQALGKPGTSQPGGVHKYGLPRTDLKIASQPTAKTGSETGTIVFVCRYGSAKSVVAARFFNRIAADEGLPFHAVARGIEPEPVIPPYVREPIRADRFEIGPEEKPVPLDAGETHNAVAVVCIMCKLPPGQLAVARQSIEWTDVPDVSDGYTAARDRILGHMKELMVRLVAK